MPAQLAICSDLDETPDAATYFELMRFLNTTEETIMGPGVGLEVGNTIYFDMAPGQLSYWNASEVDREKFRALIHSGHIDCLHSFGDLATSRSHAGRALDELVKYGCRIPIWIDHAQAVTNFGADIMQGMGDVPGHPAYHADLTMGYGIRHVWRGRTTSVIGQDRPFSLCSIVNFTHPVASVRTVAKEAAKQLLARRGHPKYSPQAGNRLVVPGELRNGTPIREFIRSNPSWGGVSCHDRGDGIHHVLTPRFLDRLSARGGPCILYTHLGKLNRGETTHCFPPVVVNAFRLLAEYQRSGKIKVTTTARLLDHNVSQLNKKDPPLCFPEIVR
ncbi:MAG: hypothetical protein EON58_01205 [Alphaproteobacteria bacterium]|nr:MAG: hypothetical protein EON58_01205 [Alphaproteobacteria bacterium]